MPVSSIAQLMLRLFACTWFVQGIIQFAACIGNVTAYGGSSLPYLMIPVAQLLSGILFWALAPRLSRLMIKGADQECTLEGVSLVDLYSTAMVCLGLYFFLSSFGDSLNWIHYYTYTRHTNPFPTDENPGFYGASKPVLTMLAGLTLVVTSRVWARKLAKMAG